MSTAKAAGTGGEDFTPTISTVAGTGTAGDKGDGDAAVQALLKNPYGVAIDGIGTLYLSEHGNHRVRKVTTDGKISTVAGTGVAGDKGDKAPVQLKGPRGLAVDREGNLYIADTDNHRSAESRPTGRSPPSPGRESRAPVVTASPPTCG